MKSSASNNKIETAVMNFGSETGALISFNNVAVRVLEKAGCRLSPKLMLSAVEEHFFSKKAFNPSFQTARKFEQEGYQYSSNVKLLDGRVFSFSRHDSGKDSTVLVVEDITNAIQQLRRERLSGLILKGLASAPTLSASLDALLRAICLCCNWPFGEIWTTRSGKLTRARVRRSTGSVDESATEASPLTTPNCPTIVAQAGLTGEIQRVINFQDYTSPDQEDTGDLFAKEPGASIALPLKAGGTVVAILHFSFTRPKPCDQMSLDLLKGMADQLAMALKCRLHASEETGAQKQLNEILMAAGDAIVSVDAHHRIQLFNRQAEILFGYNRDEAVGQHLHLLLPQSAHAVHARHLKNYDENSPSARFMGGRPEIKGRRKDGSEFPAEASVSRTIIDDEVVYTAVVRDLSALKNAEEALVLSEKKMRAIVESMPFGLTISHAESGKVLFVNEAFSALVETDSDKIVGRDLTDFVDLRTDGQVIPGKRGTERAIRTASGTPRWCMTAPVAMTMSSTESILCGYYDVTDRRTAIEALRISAHNLSEAERIAHLGNWQWEATTGHLKFSDEARRIFGIEPADSELDYNHFLRRVHIDDRDSVDQTIRAAVDKSLQYDLGFRIVRPDGTQRFIQLHAEIERDDAGRMLRMLGSLQDMTDLKHVQEELWAARELAEAANRAKSMFLANMSHELRTPLNAIIGFSEIMANSIGIPLQAAQYQEYAEDINQSGRKLLNVVDDILDLSNIECGHSELKETEFDIAEIIDVHVARLARRLADSNLTLSANIEERIPKLFADRKLFDQIVENLLSNAMKFTPAGGKIHIAARRTEDGGLCIEVEDNGIGISSQDMERIFLPFVQAEGHLSRRFDGVGLGLALTKEYVRLHDGMLRFRSEVGAGTSVLIQFPPTRVVAAPAARLVSGGGMRS